MSIFLNSTIYKLCLIKMPYGKEDFLGWDDGDTNLDLLLGEYTCIEVELSDDETVHSTTDQPSATCSKTYKCSECPFSMP